VSIADDGTDLVATRRRKLAELRAAGIDPYPHAFPGVTPIADAKAPHEGLEPGEETEARVRVAGRLHARRGSGKAAFLDLIDRTGKLQLHARIDVLGEERFARLLDAVDLGDMLGADGTIFRTRRGELSLKLEDYTVLAKSLRPPPDKFHGVSDVELRFRHRELDLMSDEDARALFVTRAKIISTIRRFLDDQGFIEVETPVLQPLYGGAAARPFTTHFNALDQTMYLRIATELYLKRCIVGGLERVYELGKDFRNEGLSPKHNPEFTMLEWYEAYADYHDIADRYEQMIAAVAQAIDYDGEIDFTPPWTRKTFAGAIEEETGLAIYEHRSLEALQEAMRARDLEVPPHERTWARLVDHLLSRYVEPKLIQPTFLMDYPVELSPFAKRHRDPDAPDLVERFECFAGGMEIANAFTELNDPDDQRARFEEQIAAARAGDEEAEPTDEAFLAALEHGMPPTGGIGTGLDRLTMLLTGRRTIREVVLFPAMRNE
jgi:lysyl-tRNA synthetase class 2